jgi:hypothetical protein
MTERRVGWERSVILCLIVDGDAVALIRGHGEGDCDEDPEGRVEIRASSLKRREDERDLSVCECYGRSFIYNGLNVSRISKEFVRSHD